jgi:D-alanyl-lipoteichoic acid acyltransferase DltB (MBOAT superfamily)
LFGFFPGISSNFHWNVNPGDHQFDSIINSFWLTRHIKIFTSLDYLNPLLLFPFVFLFAIGYYLLPQKTRWILLFIASYGFIYWIGSWSVLIVFFSTIINYLFGILISKKDQRSKLFLVLGILLNVITLFFFKYFSSLLNLDVVFGGLFTKTDVSIIIPLGISFYTLQCISYLVEVYKGLTPVELNIGIFAVYLAFFPKILSGPIERGKSMFSQIRSPEKFNLSNIFTGSSLILFGLFKKIVIADHMVLFVNEVFDHPGMYQGLTLILGILFLGFQIYMDFSGYTDIAIGVSTILGISLTKNFNNPYFSQNLIEFWNRWHISLSSWLRDYIFFPLRRFLLKKNYKSLIFVPLIIPPVVTMLVSGVWHGTGLNFICWGLFHAFFYTIVVYKRSKLGNQNISPNIFRKILNILLNFGILSVSWVIFRADSLESAWLILTSIIVKSTTLEVIFRSTFYLDYLISIVSVFLIIGVEIYIEIRGEKFQFGKLPIILRWAVYLFLTLSISILGVFQKGVNPFLYGKF